MTLSIDTIALTGGKSVLAQAELKHDFKAEGAWGRVYVWAHLDDGTTQYVYKSDGLDVSVNNDGNVSATDALMIEEQTSGTSDFRVTVKEGASGITAANGLIPTWSVCGEQIATGIVPVNVELAKPVSVVVSLNSAKMTRAADGANKPPINIPSTLTLKAIVTFDDDTTRDFALDSRVKFTIVAGDNLATLSSNQLIALASGSGTGTVTVKVTFPFYAPLISDETSVSFVQMATLTATSYPYPSYAGSTGSQKSVLNLVACTSVYQQTILSSEGTLSDGTKYDLSNYASYQSQATGVVSTGTGMTRYAKGVSVGTTSVIPSFFGVSASALPFTVTNDKTAITELLHRTGWNSQTSFVGVQGSQKTLVVEARFDDGRRFENIRNNGLGISVSDLVLIGSNDEAAITVTNQLVATLQGNSYKGVTLTVQGYCADGSVAQTAFVQEDVAPNLDPKLGDIDLGSRYGLPFPAKNLGETLTVEVRVNSQGAKLIAVQANVQWNAAHLESTGCTQGPDWAYTFLCTLKSTENQAKISAISTSSTASGSALRIATLKLSVLSTTVLSPISGSILVLSLIHI